MVVPLCRNHLFNWNLPNLYERSEFFIEYQTKMRGLDYFTGVVLGMAYSHPWSAMGFAALRGGTSQGELIPGQCGPDGSGLLKASLSKHCLPPLVAMKLLLPRFLQYHAVLWTMKTAADVTSESSLK